MKGRSNPWAGTALIGFRVFFPCFSYKIQMLSQVSIFSCVLKGLFLNCHFLPSPPFFLSVRTVTAGSEELLAAAALAGERCENAQTAEIHSPCSWGWVCSCAPACCPAFTAVRADSASPRDAPAQSRAVFVATLSLQSQFQLPGPGRAGGWFLAAVCADGPALGTGVSASPALAFPLGFSVCV